MRLALPGLLALLSIAACTVTPTAPGTPSASPQATVVQALPTLEPTTTPPSTPGPTAPTRPTPTPVAPVSLGMLTSPVGGDASAGLQARQGAELALTRINASGGILGRGLGLRVVEAGSPAEAAARLQALTNEGSAATFAITGNATAINLAAAIRSAQTPIFITATAPVLTRTGVPWIIPLLPDEDRLARAAASYARNGQRAERIVVLYATDDAGVGQFRAAQLELRDLSGIEIAGSVSANPDGSTLPAAVIQLKALNPGATLVFGKPQFLSQVMRQTKAQGVGGVFVTTQDATTIAAQDLFTADADGWFAATAPLPVIRDNENAREMTQLYRAAYRSDPDIVAAATYDGIGILAECINRARSVEPQALLDALNSIAAYDGILGRYGFTGATRGLQDVVVVRFDGKTPRPAPRP